MAILSCTTIMFMNSLSTVGFMAIGGGVIVAIMVEADLQSIFIIVSAAVAVRGTESEPTAATAIASPKT